MLRKSFALQFFSAGEQIDEAVVSNPAILRRHGITLQSISLSDNLQESSQVKAELWFGKDETLSIAIARILGATCDAQSVLTVYSKISVLCRVWTISKVIFADYSDSVFCIMT